jgi:Na+-translocating ferredoxin:NAD+ oxidoreductase RnfG subunit
MFIKTEQQNTNDNIFYQTIDQQIKSKQQQQQQQLTQKIVNRPTTIKQLEIKPKTVINNKIESKPSCELKHINSMPTILTNGYNSTNETPKLISAK